MVVTRNQRKQAQKIKFDDDGVADTEVTSVEVSQVKSQSPNPIESEDSDSDEAPEEESTSKSKSDILEKQKAIKQAEAESRRAEREKRRQQDLYNKQQQQEKQKKQKQHEELPEFLPQDILEAANSVPEPQTQSTHKKTIDFDVELKKQLKAEKLKKLKALNKASIKKGPVHVKVLQKTRGVPLAETKVVGSRDKWLKRKSLHKK